MDFLFISAETSSLVAIADTLKLSARLEKQIKPPNGTDVDDTISHLKNEVDLFIAAVTSVNDIVQGCQSQGLALPHLDEYLRRQIDNALVDSTATLQTLDALANKLELDRESRLGKSQHITSSQLTYYTNEHTDFTDQIYQSRCAMEIVLAVFKLSIALNNKESPASFSTMARGLKVLVEKVLPATSNGDTANPNLKQLTKLLALARAAQQFNSVTSLKETLLVLSPSNKQALLSSSSQTTQNRQAEAEVILRRIQQLNPTIARHFHPKKTALSDLTLRMLCSQELASGIVPSFIVLSYCWHYQDWTLAPAAKPICPGWEISQPMVDAIMALRNGANEGVWVDKLCINQADDAEKKVAIGAMDVVYRSARRVIILLEDVQLDEREEAAGLKYAEFYEDMCREVREGGIEGVAKDALAKTYFTTRENQLDAGKREQLRDAAKPFAMKMLNARWYSRAWCAHESLLAGHLRTNNPLFLCFGADGRVLSFEFRFLYYHSELLRLAEPDLPSLWPDLADYINDPSPLSLQQLVIRLQRLRPHQNPHTSALQHLMRVASLGCSNKEDLLSIALNISDTPLFFDGNLKALEDIFWIAALLAIAAGDVRPLVVSGTKLRILEGRTKQIISWVDKLSYPGLNEWLPLQALDSITAATHEYIELDLLVFTNLPMKASQASVQKASALCKTLVNLTKQHIDAHGPPLHFGEAEAKEIKRAEKIIQDSSPNHLTKRLRHFLTFLGLAIDCGIDWIRRFPSLVTQPSEKSWLYGIIGDNNFPDFTEAAIELLLMFGITSENTPNFSADYLGPTIKFLTCAGDSRVWLLSTLPRRLRAGTDDWALVQKTTNISYIVVPVAVANLPIWQRRAWVVEPFDPAADPENLPEDHLPNDSSKFGENDAVEDIFPVLGSDNADRRAKRNDERGTWRLRSRQIIFGCKKIIADGSSVVLLRGQKVYGAEDYDMKAIYAAAVKNWPRSSQEHE